MVSVTVSGGGGRCRAGRRGRRCRTVAAASHQFKRADADSEGGRLSSKLLEKYDGSKYLFGRGLDR
jgi:hypothetical protein